MREAGTCLFLRVVPAVGGGREWWCWVGNAGFGEGTSYSLTRLN